MSRVVRCNPTSDNTGAKWHAWTGTRASINLNKKACVENCVVSIHA